MEKIIELKISLDEKVAMETKDNVDVTSQVFDAFVESVETSLKDMVLLNNDIFAETVLENYSQTLPENFKNFEDMGLKIELV